MLNSQVRFKCIITFSKELQASGSGAGLSQDLETGCPKLPIVKFVWVLFFKGDPNIHRIQLQCLYLPIKIRHSILIQCHENYIGVKKIKYVWKWHFKELPTKIFWCHEGVIFEGSGFEMMHRHRAGYILRLCWSMWGDDFLSAQVRFCILVPVLPNRWR